MKNTNALYDEGMGGGVIKPFLCNENRDGALNLLDKFVKSKLRELWVQIYGREI